MFHSTVLLRGAIAAIAMTCASASAQAAEFTMGNLDRSGSRSVPSGAEGDFTRPNVEAHGLRIRWAASTAASISGAAVTHGDSVIVGDTAGFMYAFDRSTGAQRWQTCIEASCPGPDFFSGIVGNALVKGDTVYVGTLSGSLVALEAATGAMKWVHTSLVTPPVAPGLPIDSVWGGPIRVRNMIVYALAPNDEFGLDLFFGPAAFGRGAVLAVDAHTGAEIWRRPLISDADFAAGSSGAGVWNTTPTYSPELDLIFVGTGQDTNPAGGEAGSDSFFAIDARTGEIAWQRQVRTGDTWNYALPYDPLNPTDTDIGPSPAVFKVGGRTMIAAGDKRGIFWVLDAATGEILNNGGAGLDLFEGILPGPGLTGGFNLDSGYVKTGNGVRHFAVFADQTTSLQNILDDEVNFPGGVCYSSISCPIYPDTGNLLILEGDGSGEVCRFSVEDTQVFSPFHVGGMVVMRGSDNPTVYVVSVDDCGLVTSLDLPSGWSYGASVSFSDGVVYTGGGILGAPVLFAIEAALP